ncbi:GGDEF domain-containing protein [Thiolapillus brandeum]|uniref:diguanylate cyclase n=1 Tax=Thiolapillus brandeum TaxID=1076588 RepID=A0A7U6JIR3_9GAMM|nr:GGDEF domain-containing protein [Thiolapillus brandeum]BAO44500.1 signal transduction protein [Thiolapillus brandeum]
MEETTDHKASELRQRLMELDGQSTEYIDTSILLAKQLFPTDPHESLSIAQRAIALSHSLGYQEGIARAHTIAGHAQISLSNYKLARESAKKAIPVFETLNDKHGLLDARNLLGISYNTSGQFDQALDIFLTNTRLAEACGDETMLGKSLNNVACIMHDQGNYSGALDYYQRSYRCALDSGNTREVGISLINMGVTQIELGNHREAFNYLMRSLDKISHVPEIHARAMHNLSRYHQGLNNLSQARDFAAQSLAKFEGIHNIHGIIETLSSLGEILVLMGEPKQAEACFLKAIVIARQKNENTGVAHNQLLLGRLHRQAGKSSLAISELRKVLTLGDNYKTYTYEAHLELSMAYEDRQDYRKALEHHKMFMESKNRVLTEQVEQRIASMHVNFQLEQAERETELLRKKNAELAEANRKLKELMAVQKKLDAQKSRLVKQLESYANTDSLTGLFNRRYLNKSFSREFKQAQESNTPLCVLIGDLDNFKQINDRYSHETGDTVLSRVSDIIRNNIREMDVLSRYGGEEFVLVMPDTTMEDAVHISRRLKNLIESNDWESIQPGLGVTISLGLSSNTDSGDPEAMLASADKKLYSAKRMGKNQLCF